MATVFIWNNNQNGRGHKWPGHASLNITDQWASAFEENNTENFVSWMPVNNQESHSGNTRGNPNNNIFSDLVFEGYAPDHIIRLDVKEAAQKLMKTVWTGIKSKDAKYMDFKLDKGETIKIMCPDSGPSYKFYVKNCSVIVQRVIKAAKLPWNNSDVIARKSIIWTPLNLKRLANSIKGAKTILWSEYVDELKSKKYISEEESDLLKKFQRRHESHGSSKAPARNLANGTQSSYANKDNPKKAGNPKNWFKHKGESKTLVKMIKSIEYRTSSSGLFILPPHR